MMDKGSLNIILFIEYNIVGFLKMMKGIIVNIII